MHGPVSGGRRWWLAAAALIVAFLVVVAPLLTGELAPIWDADGFFVPYYTLLADFTRAGKLLLWNPWTSGGSPDHIEPQVATLGPHFLLSAFLTGGGEPGYRLHWLACWMAGLLGMLALGRRLGAPPVAAAAVALCFALSGPFTGHAQHLSFMFTFAMFPAALCRLDAALEDRSRLAAVQSGALWGLSAIGGYPGVLMITGGLLMLWVAGRVLVGGPSADTTWAVARRVPARRAVEMLACCFGCGLLVMLPATLPMLVDGVGFTDRAGTLSREVVTSSNALHPRAVATLFSPYLAGLPVARLWPYTDRSSCSLYLGAAPLLLAVHALVARPRSGLRWWLLGIALLFLGLSLGKSLPLRGWLYDLVPPTRYVRHAAIYRMGTVFALAALACLGARDLLRERGRGAARWLPLLVAVCLLSAAVSIHAGITRRVSSPQEAEGARHLWVVWTGVVLLAGASALLAGSARRTTLMGGLAALALYDARGTFKLSPTIATPVTAASWRKLDAQHVPELNLLPGGIARISYSNERTGFGPGPTNKNLLPKLPAFVGYAPMNNQLHLRWAKTPVLAARVLGKERFYFSRTAIEVAPTVEAFDRFVAASTARQIMPLLVHSRTSMKHVNRPGAVPASFGIELQAAADVEPLQLQWKSYQPARMEMEVEAPSDGWLLLTDRWARGWRARVDGQETAVEGGNFLFRALRVGRGRHTVEMTYHPFALPWLMLACWGTLLAVVVATIRQWWLRRRPRREGLALQ